MKFDQHIWEYIGGIAFGGSLYIGKSGMNLSISFLKWELDITWQWK